MHITSDSVNCEMFADDTLLNASDKNTATVQNKLQKSINEVSDWCDKNAMILHPAKAESMPLATRQKHQLRPLILNLNLKDHHLEQVHEHYIKKSVPVVTAQTLRRHIQAKAILLCSHFASPNLCIYCLGRL